MRQSRTTPIAVAWGVRSFLAALAATMVVAAASASSAAPNTGTYDLNIPSQSLTDALQSLATVLSRKLLYSSELVSGKSSEALKGQYTTEQAFSVLLAGTQLTYELTSDGFVLIRKMGDNTISKSSDSPSGTLADGLFRVSQSDSGQSNTPINAENTNTSSSSSSKEDGKSRIEEIIVTAQKREERLQDVPISISVLGGDELDSSRSPGVTDILTRVPAVAISENGQTGGTQIAIRGVTATAALFAGANPIAYYLDTAPFGFARSGIAPDANIYDLDRIEVLKGPQGTLYGAGGVGGVVRILTKNADPSKFAIKSRASYSATRDGGNNYRADGAVNVPLVTDRLAVRAVVGFNDQSGYIDAANRPDINDSDQTSYRFRVFAEPVDDLVFNLSYWKSKSDAGATPTGNDAYERTAVNPRSNFATDLEVYNGTIEYTHTLFDINSSSNYIKYINDGFFHANPSLGLTTLLKAKSLSQEVTLNSTLDGPWQFTVGGYYRDAEDSLQQVLVSYADSNANVIQPSNLDTSKSYAAFGEIRRSFLDDVVEITAGLRYFHDRGATEGPNSRFAATYKAVTPRFVAAWKPNRDFSPYVSYSEGFRSGLYQGELITSLTPQSPFPPAKPDRLHNYEIGAKGSLLAGLLGYEVAAYYMDWKDIQQNLQVPIPGTSVSANAIVSGGSASGPGFELSLVTQPFSGMDVGGSFSWNGLTFDKDIFSGGVLTFAKGEILSLTPEITAGAFADYTFPIGTLNAQLSTSLNYTSGLNSRATIGAFEGDALSSGRASFSLSTSNGITGTLFVDNITDERGAVIREVNTDRSVRRRPRTVGLQFEYRYGK